ncbi:MAG TPA: glutamate-1-semialdehyde 2,1-aminomutase [Candidatus Polarisedimenticolia bacterium]|jgi:glutamate-1-semialdehyde 2,1-aminomutase|nr:glutamate-1-semialdehyde 2,1-aminomutase [Candidatus Polarisedimenticolia bacterium]
MSATSRDLFEEALRFIPGGVNSPVRAFKAVGGNPVFLARGKGCRVWDVEGREYLDYVGSWGPLILGHAREEVLDAVTEAMQLGTSFGAPTEAEVEMARALTEAIPSMRKVRLVSSGTEATLSTVRLARAATGRDLIVKAEGCYHGHVDALLVAAGSGVATLGIPGTPGVPREVAAQTLVVPYNDSSALEEVFQRHGERIALLILEPVAGNMGVVIPQKGYLGTARELTRRYGSLLALDEVITGFRLLYGGVQSLFGIEPDLTTLGKVIGGGFPVGAYGGRADLMDRIAPAGPVYQAGTLSGNPIAMRAGLTTLQLLKRLDPYPRLEQLGKSLAAGLAAGAREAGIPLTVNVFGSMLTPFFTAAPVTDFRSAARSDVTRYAEFFRKMLQRNIYLPPGQYEALFLSTAHGESDLDRTLSAAREAFAEMAA